MSIAILGCGPAGLFAAHAAVSAGHDVVIYSKPRMSHMNGAQYLHEPIPGLSGESFTIDYRLEGTVEGYREKVYGDMSDVQVSPQTLVGQAEAWDIREAYGKAWSKYAQLIQPFDIRWEYDKWNAILRDHELVISTIPAKLLCYNPMHQFLSQKIWSTDYVKYQGAFILDDTGEMDDNIVICSGDPDDWWYRQSRIHGYENTEWPHDRKPKADPDHLWEVEKPISTDCSCFKHVVRLGRYGSWTKGILSHEAFYQTQHLLATTTQQEAIA